MLRAPRQGTSAAGGKRELDKLNIRKCLKWHEDGECKYGAACGWLHSIAEKGHCTFCNTTRHEEKFCMRPGGPKFPGPTLPAKGAPIELPAGKKGAKKALTAAMGHSNTSSDPTSTTTSPKPPDQADKGSPPATDAPVDDAKAAAKKAKKQKKAEANKAKQEAKDAAGRAWDAMPSHAQQALIASSPFSVGHMVYTQQPASPQQPQTPSPQQTTAQMMAASIASNHPTAQLGASLPPTLQFDDSISQAPTVLAPQAAPMVHANAAMTQEQLRKVGVDTLMQSMMKKATPSGRVAIANRASHDGDDYIAPGSYAWDTAASEVFRNAKVTEDTSKYKTTSMSGVNDVSSKVPVDLHEDIIVKGEQLLPATRMALSGVASTSILQGIRGPLIGDLLPEDVEAIVAVYEKRGHNRAKIRNNLPYVDSEVGDKYIDALHKAEGRIAIADQSGK